MFVAGTYFGESALVYNLTDVAAIDFSGTLANEMIENGDDVNATIQDLTDSLQNGHFSFVLVTNGTNAGLVPIAFYDTTEEDEIVNIKKTLAASFQAEYSFVGTAARTELDPQALHNTTYTLVHYTRILNISFEYLALVPNQLQFSHLLLTTYSSFIAQI